MSRYDSNFSENDTENIRKRKGRVDRTTKRRVKYQFLIATFFAILAIFGYIFVSTDSGSLSYVVRVDDSIPSGFVITDSVFDKFSVVALPSEVIEENAYTDNDPQKLIDLLYKNILNETTLYPLLKGQQIRPDYFTGVGTGLPNRNLAPDERQIAISLSASRAIAGTVKSGDIVDVFVVVDGNTGLLAQNIKILSVSLPQSSIDSVAASQLQSQDSNLSDYIPNDPIGGTYIIVVKAEDVSKFFAAENSGILYFALRNQDSLPIKSFTITEKDLICQDESSVACKG
jgi:Flp pilus assembly protein CpaB